MKITKHQLNYWYGVSSEIRAMLWELERRVELYKQDSKQKAQQIEAFKKSLCKK